MIEFRQVTKVFGSGDTCVRAVNNLSFTCPRGAFWSVMGPSGSGKSTILHLIAGLTAPTSGSILVEDRDIARMSNREMALLRRRLVGYIMQTFNLLSYLNVAQNVGLPLLLDELGDDEIAKRVEDVLSLVGMLHRATHSPTHLSGGEQQRVAIARALVIKPAVLLADEPTGNLDRANGRAIMDLIQDINERTGVTVLLVTHDPVFAACSQRIQRLVDGQLEQETDLAGLVAPDHEDLDVTRRQRTSVP